MAGASGSREGLHASGGSVRQVGAGAGVDGVVGGGVMRGRSSDDSPPGYPRTSRGRNHNADKRAHSANATLTRARNVIGCVAPPQMASGHTRTEVVDEEVLREGGGVVVKERVVSGLWGNPR